MASNTARRHTIGIPDEAITAYTDGSCLDNATYLARTGAGVYYGPDDPNNASIRISGTDATNQTGEIAAMYRVANTHHHLPAPLHIVSDSRYAINGLTIHFKKWEDQGFVGVTDRTWFQAAASWLRERGDITSFKWVKGHSITEGNKHADTLAGEGARKPDTQELVPLINPNFHVTGIKIAVLTQHLAYEAIREDRTAAYVQRRTTTTTLDYARYGAEPIAGRIPIDRHLWKAARHPDFSIPIRIFMWKLMHGAHRVCDWWLRVPTYEHRAECKTCGTLETMQHILTECSAPGQQDVWDLVRLLWERRGSTWIPITYGTVLACGTAEFTTPGKKPLPGPSRLFRILISEAAYLIWSLRCRRVIEHDDDPAKHPTRREIVGRWHKAINNRLSLDQARTHSRFHHKALKRELVLLTWSGTIQDEDDRPSDWVNTRPGVLVSSDVPEQWLRVGA